MRKPLTFQWKKGFIKIKQDRELSVEAENSKIFFSQREIDIKGLFMSYNEYFIGRKKDRKVIYVNFAFPLKGISSKKADELIMNNSDLSLGPFDIHYTKLEGVSEYITFYMPSGFLYEIVILTEDKMALFTIGRRQVYILDEKRGTRKLLLL